jgi:multiple sugar transport system permease protein
MAKKAKKTETQAAVKEPKAQAAEKKSDVKAAQKEPEVQTAEKESEVQTDKKEAEVQVSEKETDAQDTEKEPSAFSQWISKRKTQKILVMVTFMIIPLILLFTFTYLPFGEMVSYSFYKMKYTGTRTFVGWDNYVNVFKRDDCFGALKLSLYYMAGSVVQLAIALYLATILSFKVKLGNLFKGFMFFPYLINGIAIGFIFKFFYTRGFVFDTVLQWCGFDLDNLPYWLMDQSINNISLVGTSVWRYFGQNMVLFIGAIMSVDSDLYEAAMLDGASKFQQFIYIILPSIKTIVVLNIILSITGSLSAFEPPYVITSGANGTGTYFVVMHEIAHTQQKLGLASAMAVILLCIILFATLLQKLFFKYVFKDGEDDAYTKAEEKKMKEHKKAMKKAAKAARKVGA